MPSLLGMDHWITSGTGMEHGIGVNIDEIFEILLVLRCQDITRSIGVSEGIEEGLETSLEQLHEWFLGAVFTTSTKNGMLENVRDTGGIIRGCTEGNSKHFVIVVIYHTEKFSAGLLVTVHGTVGTVFVNIFFRDDLVRWMLDDGDLFNFFHSGSLKFGDGRCRCRHGSSASDEGK